MAAIFQTPLSIVQKFAASGADGLVASHRALESGGPDGMEALFALQVAEHRDEQDPKTQAMIDVVRPVWSGLFDDEVGQLTAQEVQTPSAGFLWHTYLNESSAGRGARYRAFVAACTGGPIPAGPDEDQNLGLVGVSELGDEQKEELQKLQEHLKQLRRKSSKFHVLPVVGAASGAEYEWACRARGRTSASGIASRGDRAISARLSFQPSCFLPEAVPIRRGPSSLAERATRVPRDSIGC